MFHIDHGEALQIIASVKFALQLETNDVIPSYHRKQLDGN